MKKIELDKVFIELLAPNISPVTVKDSSSIDIEDIIDIKKVNIELTKGLNYGLIIESGNYTTISNDARTIMTSKAIEKGRIATVIIINSFSQRLLAGFYIKISNPATPTKVFSNLKDGKKMDRD